MHSKSHNRDISLLQVKAISRPGETISSSNFSTKPGGKGANQAVAVSKAGGSVEFVGAVGPGGQWLVQELVNHGVGVQHMLNVLVRSDLERREPQNES